MDDEFHSERRVAILVNTVSRFGHNLVRGVHRYAREHGRWMFVGHPLHFTDIMETAVWAHCDGVLCTVYLSEQVTRLQQHFGPRIVDVGQFVRGLDVAQVVVDSLAVGRMAADHLMDAGLHRFAFFGQPGMHYAELRRDGFCQRLRERGFDCQVYEPQGLPYWLPGAEPPNEFKQLTALPKPLGVFASHDPQARLIADYLHFNDIRVPEEVAIVGVDDDDLVCEMATPPLSSVAIDSTRIGFLAASVLDRLMKGQDPGPQLQTVPPTHVVHRQSTDVLAIDDPDVVAAIRFIRQFATQPIGVDEVVAAVPLSRRVLERRFLQLVGRSLHAEITRARLKVACGLLRDTRMSVTELACEAGFTDATHLGYVLKKEMHVTPLAYRRASRAAQMENSK